MHHPRPNPSSAVSWWVHRLAHARMVGADDPEPPRTVRFDKTTPTARHADLAANAIAHAARLKLDDEGWWFVDHELWPDEDVVWSEIHNRHAWLELRTGPVGAAWLDLGQRLDAIELGTGVPYLAIVVHVPRAAGGNIVNFDARPSGNVVRAWQAWNARIEALEDGAQPTRSPGFHCRRCGDHQCPVRVEQ